MELHFFRTKEAVTKEGYLKGPQAKDHALDDLGGPWETVCLSTKWCPSAHLKSGATFA